jgi:N,N'-diacetyllegionaminate synthase
LKIGDFNTEEKVMVVAEIGNNHEGDFDLAQKMVEKAAETGVDAVKFQTFKTKHYVSKANPERFAKLKSFELTYEQFEKLSIQARDLGLLFISTPFDLESADAIRHFVDGIKIASGDNNFYPLIEKISEYNLPTLVSLGLLGINDVKKTIEVLSQDWIEEACKDRLAVLHCVCSYPVPEDEANLLAIQHLQAELDCTVGYSDHVIGNEAALLSVALGARIVEKHFTLDHNFSDFRDHQLSADISQMKELVQRIRASEKMLGDPRKKREDCEEALAPNVRRSVIVNRDMNKGDRITIEDLSWVRPAGGIAPGNENLLLGKYLRNDLSAGDLINQQDLD